jgi:lipopolysaccharide export LptBFGC system permease protein LptF
MLPGRARHFTVGIYARHLLLLFVRPFMGIFVLLQVFASFAGMLTVQGKHPYLPLLDVAAGIPDSLLLILPTTLPVALCVGYLACIWSLHSNRQLLPIQLAGRDPRGLQVPIAVLGVGCSALMFWLAVDVIPKAEFRSRSTATALREDTASLAARIAWGRDVLPGFNFGFCGAEGGRFSGFSMASRGATVATAVSAATMDAEIAGDGRYLQINLYDGRLIQAKQLANDALDVELNMQFECLRYRQDAREYSQPSKALLLDPKYYTNRELSLYEEQLRLLSRKGLNIESRARLRAAAVPAIKAARLDAALLPALLLAAAILTMGGLAPGRWRRSVGIASVCMLALLIQHFATEERARNGLVQAVWVALLPGIELVAIMAVWTAAAIVRRRGAP